MSQANTAHSTTTSDDIRLTPKGEAYATAHGRSTGKLAGLPAPRSPRSRTSKRDVALQRAALEAKIEEAVAMLDLLDGDWDLEPPLGYADSVDQGLALARSQFDRGQEGGDVQDEPHDAEDEKNECDAVEVCGESDGAEGGLGTVRDHPVDQDDLDKYREESLAFQAMRTEQELTDPAGKARELLDTIPNRKRRYRGDNIGGLVDAFRVTSDGRVTRWALTPIR